jgi:hypothetical protein
MKTNLVPSGDNTIPQWHSKRAIYHIIDVARDRCRSNPVTTVVDEAPIVNSGRVPSYKGQMFE